MTLTKPVVDGSSAAGPDQAQPRWLPLRLVLILAVCGALTVLLATWSLTQGATAFSLAEVWGALRADTGDSAPFVIREIRLPRIIAAIVGGAALGIAGVILQDALRNPIADPGLLGISQSVALVGVLLVLFPGVVPDLARPVLFLGAGLVTGALIAVIARAVRDPVRLILVGFLLAMFFSTITEVITLLGPQDSGDQLASFFRFQIGSLAGVTWSDLHTVWLWLALAVPGAMLTGRSLNLLQLGDDTATGLGMNVVRTRLGLLFVAVLLVAPAVSVIGPVEFVALIAPHVCRPLLKTTNAYLVLPAAGAVGGLTVLAADTIGRLLFFPVEVPAGLWTLIVIGPAAVWLAADKLGGSGKGAE
ncbi:MAG: iron ABC transporter permease [Microbacterium sp.]